MTKTRTTRPIERDSLAGAASVSAVIHLAALVGALVVWPFIAPPIALPPDVVPVDLLAVADETNIAPEEKALEPPPDPQPLEMPATTQPTPPTFSEPPPPPPPEEDIAALEPDPAPPPPEVKQPPQPRFALVTPRAKPKPEKPKEDFDKMLSGLVDKLAKEPAQEKKDEPVKAAAQRSLEGAGAQTAMTMSEIDALKGQLAKCWNVDPGAPDPASLVFRVKMFLNEDGTVAAPPQLLDQGRLADPYFRAAAESAKRAIMICQPYALPPEKFATWGEITIEFDPRRMAGY